MIAAIVGAGDTGAGLAFALAVRNRIHEIRLIDEAGPAAAGKALDIQQATPVLGSAARVTGGAGLEAVAGAHVVVLADRHGTPSREWEGEAGLALLGRLLASNPSAPIVCSGAAQGWLIERAIAELNVPPSRILGSAPAALEAGVRGLIAAEAETSPGAVALAVAGRPPDEIFVGWEAAAIDNEPAIARLSTQILTRIERGIRYLWPPGPVALGSAAADAVERLLLGLQRPFTALAAIPIDGTPAVTVAAATVRVETGRVAAVTLPALAPRERVALESVFAPEPAGPRRSARRPS